MAEPEIYYFAFGSNMNTTRMKNRLPMIVSYKFAVLEDYELVFHSKSSKPKSLKGFCTIKERKGSKVEGILYTLPHNALDLLDRFEGAPWSYRREKIIVVSENQEKIASITYMANRCSPKLIPSTDYLFHVLQNSFFSEDYHNALIRTPTLEEISNEIPLFISESQLEQLSKELNGLLSKKEKFVLHDTTQEGNIYLVTKSQLYQLEEFFLTQNSKQQRFIGLVYHKNYSSEELSVHIGVFMTSNISNVLLHAAWYFSNSKQVIV